MQIQDRKLKEEIAKIEAESAMRIKQIQNSGNRKNRDSAYYY
ncbi:unnamed protein product [marine sediment metagenome]|uniref:Uncharacterized protein n=1 Tax=marine sediment metagenome TaxID=412755 RepID=X1LFV0_9ZZZZ